MQFVQVALPIPVDQCYAYSVPDVLQDRIKIGSGVVVPFGKRILTGVVTGEPESEIGEDVRLRDVQDLIDVEPVATDEQLDLTRWIADYYMCSWGEAIRATLPPGLDAASENRVQRKPDILESEDLKPRLQGILEKIPFHESITVKALQRDHPDATRQRLGTLEKFGLIELSSVLRRPRVSTLKKKFIRFLDTAPSVSPKGIRQQAVLSALTEPGSECRDWIRQSVVLSRSGASSTTIRRLAELGYIEVETRETERTSGLIDPISAPREIELHESQQCALREILESVEASRYSTFLLHGVTGSGKTEVYIEALKRVRASDKSGIILVPEISLTPQTVKRFRSHFGNDIAVLHSRMSPGERFDAWRGIRSGRYPIVIGPRSAVLAPVPSLGLIVVDEEHEPTYKQFDPAPRYHARDVAIMRARENGAVCVLGSATPSLESLSNARSGKYTLLSMTERVPVAEGRAVLPTVRIVDLRNERRKDGSTHILSEMLKRAISDRLDAGQQVILLQNRRGYAPVIICQQCGWAPECEDCSVTMTYHKVRRHLRCHYCGQTRRLPQSCAECHDRNLAQVGVGTQRVEEEIQAFLPEARVARMDFDTTSRKNAHHAILKDFEEGKADILLGTQMVAKGLDFGNVTLVGVIDADTGLYLPDIRAEERTFQLLTQVAGRAGRADLPGEVILQTRNPGHRVIQYAMRHDFERFAEDALPEREVLGYPPSGRIVAILFSGPDERHVLGWGRRWAAVFSRMNSGIELLGPSPSFIGRIRRQYRAQIVIKIPQEASHRRVRGLIRLVNDEMGAPPRHARLAVDVDPMGLL